jgi:L-histidine N-alpha-methyltransferase
MPKPLTKPPPDRLSLVNCLAETAAGEAGREILAGLSQPQKSLPSKYFYDAYGSWLFEEICRLPEYYLTRTELALLKQTAGEIMAFFSEAGGDLVELGSGSNQKVKILLAAAGPAAGNLRYLPVDISSSALSEASWELLDLYEDLEVLGVIADFTRCLDYLPAGRKLITFLGSTIGNFTREERLAFLRRVAQAMGPGDRFVVGLDMVKPAGIITAAYNDQQGVTAAFNKNILDHLNRRMNADFAPEDFEHQAVYREELGRVEMHLRAKRATAARIADLNLTVHCQAGETIRTEICQKFSRESAGRDFRAAGLQVVRWYSDPNDWFSLAVLKKIHQGRLSGS